MRRVQVAQPDAFTAGSSSVNDELLSEVFRELFARGFPERDELDDAFDELVARGVPASPELPSSGSDSQKEDEDDWGGWID